MAIRVGIIGYGQMGMWHAECTGRVRGFALHSVFDLTPARRKAAEKSHGCPTFERLDEFLQDAKLDLAVVATPSHAHVEPVLAALKSGKHVICEKPIARTEQEARRMFAAADAAKRMLLTFQNRRFDDDFLTTRKVVESGKLGDIHDIRVIRWQYTGLMQTFGIKEFRPQWRSEAAYGGGVLLDFGPHLIDQLLLLVPAAVESVFCDLRGRRWTRDADDQFIAVIRFAGGTNAVIEYSQNAIPAVDVSWAITGERGGYRYENGGLLYSRTKSGAERIRRCAKTPTDWDALYRNIREVVAGKCEPAVKPRETLRLMRVLDALRKSSESGQAVVVRDEFGPVAVKRSARRTQMPQPRLKAQ